MQVAFIAFEFTEVAQMGLSPYMVEHRSLFLPPIMKGKTQLPQVWRLGVEAAWLQVTLQPRAPVAFFLSSLVNSTNMSVVEVNEKFFIFPQTLNGNYLEKWITK